MENKNYFAEMYGINVNDNTEKKNGLTYLSWAWAWAEIKKLHPTTTYKIYENANGLNYHTDGRTCWVKCSVTCEGIENIEYLPIMDFRNASIPVERVTSMDVNKTIQRCLTKCVARHGLGLYIYAGEDLPEEEQENKLAERVVDKKPTQKPAEPRREAKKPVADKVDTPKQNAPVEPPVPSTQYTSNTKVLQFGNKSLEEIYAADGINGIREAYKTAQALGDQYLMDLVKEYGTYRSAKQA